MQHPRCFLPTSLLAAAAGGATAAAEQQRPQKEVEKGADREEGDVPKRRLGRVEAARLLDGLVDALRLQQVLMRDDRPQLPQASEYN